MNNYITKPKRNKSAQFEDILVCVCVNLCVLDHLLRDLKLLDHPDLVVHLDPTPHQVHLCAVKI